LDAREEDAEYSFTSHDKNVDDDDGERTIADQRRNVFSKIPRVGRSQWSSYDQNRPNGF